MIDAEHDPWLTQLDTLAAMCEGYGPLLAPYDSQLARDLGRCGRRLAGLIPKLEALEKAAANG
jgi:hypothetical protein